MLELVFTWLPKPLPSGGTEPARPSCYIYTLRTAGCLSNAWGFPVHPDSIPWYVLSVTIINHLRPAQAGNCSHLLKKSCQQQEHRWAPLHSSEECTFPSFFTGLGYTWTHSQFRCHKSVKFESYFKNRESEALWQSSTTRIRKCKPQTIKSPS